MGCEIIADTLDFEVESLEAISPNPSDSKTIGPGYPFPMLQRSGHIRQITLRTITLRNPYLEATFCPDLGGRILSLTSLSNGASALPKGINLVEDPVRGFAVAGGLELTLNGTRPGAMAAVDFATQEGDSAEITMFEFVHGRNLAWTLHAELSPDSPGLEVTLTLQNRSNDHQTIEVGWRWPGDRVGLAGDAVVSRNMAPHEVFTTQLFFAPLPFAPLVTNRLGAMGLEGETLHVLPFHDCPPSKLLVNTDEGPFEAPVSLTAHQATSINIGSLPGKVLSVAVLNQGQPSLLWPEESPKHYADDAGTRHFAYWQRALDALQLKDFASADLYLETSLLYNGDDPMAWWLKAVVQRHLGETGERAELLNAHFLCPLDPALRSEAFLSQTEAAKEGSPLIAPLMKDPDALTEVVCLLIECHLIEDASRLIDEVLRHGEHRMLRYLLSYLHLSQSGMEFEAATHVQKAEAIPMGPPYPWRSVERRALIALATRFKDQERLQEFARLVQR